MSSLCALGCLPSVKKQTCLFSHFCSIYNKTIITCAFCDIQNNHGLCKGYQPQLLASAGIPCLDLDCSVYHNTLIQVNCLLLFDFKLLHKLTSCKSE